MISSSFQSARSSEMTISTLSLSGPAIHTSGRPASVVLLVSSGPSRCRYRSGWHIVGSVVSPLDRSQKCAPESGPSFRNRQAQNNRTGPIIDSLRGPARSCPGCGWPDYALGGMVFEAPRGWGQMCGPGAQPVPWTPGTPGEAGPTPVFLLECLNKEQHRPVDTGPLGGDNLVEGSEFQNS